MANEKYGGIVGKYPNSKRHGEAIGQGSDSPIIVPDINRNRNNPEKIRRRDGS